jgi:hypothetical protein
MHKSRFCALVIDCKNADLEAAGRFWSAALGRKVKDRDGNYVSLDTRPDEPIMLLQTVDHESRVHLDIESDDVEAEVQRLEKLGAKRLRKVQTWWVLEAPTGQKFCVVQPQRGPLPDTANQW